MQLVYAKAIVDEGKKLQGTMIKKQAEGMRQTMANAKCLNGALMCMRKQGNMWRVIENPLPKVFIFNVSWHSP